jgi:hypothetical protein
MWIFTITPDWLYHTLFFTSLTAVLVGLFLGKISFIKQYTTLLKWGGLTVLVISLFLEGALYDYNVMQERIKEAKAQALAAEQASKDANDKLAKMSNNFKQKNNIKKEYITRYIDKEITKYDKTCVIPKEFVKAHNDSAEKAK